MIEYSVRVRFLGLTRVCFNNVWSRKNPYWRGKKKENEDEWRAGSCETRGPDVAAVKTLPPPPSSPASKRPWLCPVHPPKDAGD